LKIHHLNIFFFVWGGGKLLKTVKTRFREFVLKFFLVLFGFILVKYGPADLKYGWDEFIMDIQNYKAIGFVLASTLLPNVLSDIQVLLTTGGGLTIHMSTLDPTSI